MIFYWIFAIFGASETITITPILEHLRSVTTLRTNWIVKQIHKLLTCPICLSFWLGMLSGEWYSPTDNALFDGFLSCGVVCILHGIFVKLTNKTL